MSANEFDPASVVQEFLNNERISEANNFLSEPIISKVFSLAIRLINLSISIDWAVDNNQPCENAKVTAKNIRRQLKDHLENDLDTWQQATMVEVIAELGAEVGFWGQNVNEQNVNYAIDLGFQLCDPDSGRFIRAWIQLTRKAQWQDKSIDAQNIQNLINELENPASIYYKKVFVRTASANNPKMAFLLQHQSKMPERGPSEENLKKNVEILKAWVSLQDQPEIGDTDDDQPAEKRLAPPPAPEPVKTGDKLQPPKAEEKKKAPEEEFGERFITRMKLRKALDDQEPAERLVELALAVLSADRDQIVDNTEKIEILREMITVKKKDLEKLKDEKREEESLAVLNTINCQIAQTKEDLRSLEAEVEKLQSSKSEPPKSTTPPQSIPASAGIRPGIQGGHVGKAPEAKPTPSRKPEPASVAPANVGTPDYKSWRFDNEEQRVEEEHKTVVNPRKKASILEKELDKEPTRKHIPEKEPEEEPWESKKEAIEDLERYPDNSMAKNLIDGLKSKGYTIAQTWRSWQNYLQGKAK